MLIKSYRTPKLNNGQLEYFGYSKVILQQET